MTTDRYAALRAAIAAGPTPGPWEHVSSNGGYEHYVYAPNADYSAVDLPGPVKVAFAPPSVYGHRDERDAEFIARCDPETIATLLEERDALASASREPTDEQVTAAARALSDLCAAQCNVDPDDNWKIHGDEFRNDAEHALRAALAAQERP